MHSTASGAGGGGHRLVAPGSQSRRTFFFFFQAEDGIRDYKVTGVQTCALPISIIPGALALARKQSLPQAFNASSRPWMIRIPPIPAVALSASARRASKF